MNRIIPDDALSICFIQSSSDLIEVARCSIFGKLGFRFVFQSLEKTLTDTEIDYIINDIVKLVTEIDHIEVPGYEYKDV